MTAESKQTHNDFETEQNDFDDFETVEGTKDREVKDGPKPSKWF